LDGSLPPWRVLDSEPRSVTSPDEPPPTGVVPWPIVLGAIAIVSLSVAGVIVIASMRGPTGADVGAGLADEAGATPAIVVVEVEGAVAHPGVYRLVDGSRVGDAIAAAGGYSPRVDAASTEREVNLATVLADGDRIVVPSRDTATPEGEEPAPDATDAAAAGRVDVNTATQAELEALPGIGPVTAGKIIAAREERPFRSAAELLERNVVGKATFEKIRDLVSPGT